MPDLNDIIWAAETFKILYYNTPLIVVLKNISFINNLRNSPQELEVSDVRNLLLQFLNQWKCRLKDDDTTALNLRNCIIDVHQDLLSIQNFSILDFNFQNKLNRDKIAGIFERFWAYGITRNYGPTCISKTLHVINPDLFVMWDEKIRLHYWTQNKNIFESGGGYCSFLIHMKEIAELLVAESSDRFNTNDPAGLICEKLNINPSLSLAKFIDEYNYLFYTQDRQREEDWRNPF